MIIVKIMFRPSYPSCLSSFPDKFNFIGEGKYYFGLELEVYYDINQRYSDMDEEWYGEYHHRINTLVDKNKDWLYVLSDGSLQGYNGLEFVTHPIGIDYLLSKGLSLIDQIRLHDCECDESCGFHVHVGRRELNDNQMISLLHFMYNERNEDFLFGLSNRTMDKFDCWADPCWEEDISISEYVKNCQYQTDKNIVCVNERSLEFRMFGGTVDKKQIQANIEFVLALLEYTSDKKSKNLLYGNFIAYVNRRQSLYPELYSFIRDLRLQEKF